MNKKEGDVFNPLTNSDLIFEICQKLEWYDNETLKEVYKDICDFDIKYIGRGMYIRINDETN